MKTEIIHSHLLFYFKNEDTFKEFQKNPFNQYIGYYENKLNKSANINIFCLVWLINIAAVLL